MAYEAEFDAFRQLKAGLSKEVATEFVTALEILHSRFDTAVPENRFIVGGALERFMHALLLSSGVDLQRDGPTGTGTGFVLSRSHAEISLKSEFTTKSSARIGLVNKQGHSHPEWTAATLFVFSEVGILYCDPSMVPKGSVKDRGDQIAISRRDVEQAAAADRYRLDLPIPTKQASSAAHSERASETIALQILQEQGLTKIRQFLP